MDNMIARRGGLIVLEGLDHSGKTTQAKLVGSQNQTKSDLVFATGPFMR